MKQKSKTKILNKTKFEREIDEKIQNCEQQMPHVW